MRRFSYNRLQTIVLLLLITLWSGGVGVALPLESTMPTAANEEQSMVLQRTLARGFQRVIHSVRATDVVGALSQWERAAQSRSINLVVSQDPLWTSAAGFEWTDSGQFYPSDELNLMDIAASAPDFGNFSSSEGAVMSSPSTTSVVPEPATGILCGLGLAVWACRRRFRG